MKTATTRRRLTALTAVIALLCACAATPAQGTVSGDISIFKDTQGGEALTSNTTPFDHLFQDPVNPVYQGAGKTGQ